MLRVTIIKRTEKRKGTIKLRFRAIDGRAVQLYYRSKLKIDVDMLDKLKDDGTVKNGVKLIDVEQVKEIEKIAKAIQGTYDEMVSEGILLVSENLQRKVDLRLQGREDMKAKPETLLERFSRYMTESFKAHVFADKRLAANKVVYRSLGRFLHIMGRRYLTPKEFTAEMVVSFSDFLVNEYEFVPQWPLVYGDVKQRDIPKEQRKNTTVAARLKILRAFFSTLVQRSELGRSPFGMIDVSTRKTMMREDYDVPVSLTLGELEKIRKTDVPKSLKETKAAFLLQCSVGIRIGDFQKLTMENVCVSADGVPYLQYIPAKTARISREPVKTPLIPSAVEIVRKYQFSFPILRYPSGKDGYNTKIKRLLKTCGIDRNCAMFDEKLQQTIFKRLYDIASSKLSRKTFVNLAKSCQVDMYAAGLHKRGSDAVERYAHIDLDEHFRLLCYAFGESETKVDENLHPIKKPKQETDRISEIVKGLSEQERKKLLQLLTDNQ